MSAVTAFIGMGSNLENPEEQIQQALISLSGLKAVSELICAPWFRSKAIGPGDQPDYINTVARLKTTLNPFELLEALQSIENNQGRQRQIRWGARTLDLDLLIFGDQIINTERLQIPHPEMHRRGFVILPLSKIAPNLTMPNGVKIQTLLANCDINDLIQIDSAHKATGTQ